MEKKLPEIPHNKVFINGEWKDAPPQPEEKEVKTCRWVKASERLPEYIQRGFSKMSDYVAIRLYDDYEKRMVISVARYCHDRKQWFDTRYNSDNNNVVEPVKWLEEISSPVPNKEAKSKEDILGQINNTGWDGFGNPMWHFELIIQAMEAYASQFKPSHKEGGQEEELKKQLEESLLLYQNLSNQIMKDQQEIERLKGLIRTLVKNDSKYTRKGQDNLTLLIQRDWEDYKSQNNL